MVAVIVVVAILATGCGGGGGSAVLTAETPKPAGSTPSPIATMICRNEAIQEIDSAVGKVVAARCPGMWGYYLDPCQYGYSSGSMELSVKVVFCGGQTKKRISEHWEFRWATLAPYRISARAHPRPPTVPWSSARTGRFYLAHVAEPAPQLRRSAHQFWDCGDCGSRRNPRVLVRRLTIKPARTTATPDRGIVRAQPGMTQSSQVIPIGDTRPPRSPTGIGAATASPPALSSTRPQRWWPGSGPRRAGPGRIRPWPGPSRDRPMRWSPQPAPPRSLR